MDAAFIELLHQSITACDIPPLLAALEEVPFPSVRLHPVRRNRLHSLPPFLAESNPVPWCPQGYSLPRRPVFGTDPLFHAGAYYVQEASSMAVWQLKDYWSPGPLRVLDACAAPGGKSTLLLDLLPPGSLLVSNEPISGRTASLAENIAKWGYAQVTVTRNDPSAFGELGGWFDVVLVDAPCSGEGMFRKDPAAREQWSPANVALCAARQKRIISDLWPVLRPGGILAYSTCTFNHFEDQDQVEWMQQTFDAHLLRPWQKFLPPATCGEGFFLALMQKGEAATPGSRPRFSPSAGKHPARPITGHPTPLEGDYLYYQKGDLLKAVPAACATEMAFLEQHLCVVHSGIAVATQKGKDWIPHADLALALDLRSDAFPAYDASLEEAQTYLRRQPLNLPPLQQKGHVLVKYCGLPLGFVKHLGNRTNNLYPAARRIFN